VVIQTCTLPDTGFVSFFHDVTTYSLHLPVVTGHYCHTIAEHTELSLLVHCFWLRCQHNVRRVAWPAGSMWNHLRDHVCGQKKMKVSLCVVQNPEAPAVIFSDFFMSEINMFNFYLITDGEWNQTRLGWTICSFFS
jgi:hypothetical protein